MLCPKCGCDVYQLEDSILHSPTDSEDFKLAIFIISNCSSCEQLVKEALQERADIMKELEDILGHG